jgi:hypothetical protein
MTVITPESWALIEAYILHDENEDGVYFCRSCGYRDVEGYLWVTDGVYTYRARKWRRYGEEEWHE